MEGEVQGLMEPSSSGDRDEIVHRFLHALTIADIHSPVELRKWWKALDIRDAPNLALAVRMSAHPRILASNVAAEVTLWISDRQKASLRRELLTRLRGEWPDALWHWQEDMELILLLTYPEHMTKADVTDALERVFGYITMPLRVHIAAGASRPVENASLLSAAIRSARQAARQAEAEGKAFLHVDDMELFTPQAIEGTAADPPLETAIRACRSALQRVVHQARQQPLELAKRSILEELVALINRSREAGVPVDDEELSGIRLFDSLLKAPDWTRLLAWVDANGLVFLGKLSQVAEQSRSRIVQQAITYITAHLHEDLFLEGIAGHCAVSHFYLSHLFRKETGTTVTGFVRKARIDRAMALLKDPGLSIADVAYRVGYQDPNYFSKSFRSYVGVSPTEFRAL